MKKIVSLEINEYQNRARSHSTRDPRVLVEDEESKKKIFELEK